MDARRLSASTFPYREEPLENALGPIAAAGFKKVDLLGRAPHFELDPTDLDLAALKAKVEGYGLKIANLASYCGDFAQGDDAAKEAELRRVKRTVDAAVFLGARSIRVFRGGGLDDARYVSVIAPWFKRAAEYAAEKKIYLGIENHGGGISNVPEVFRDLCQRVGSQYFGMLYDPCNCHTKGGDYRAMLEGMIDHAVHVHIKDGTKESNSQKTTMLGQGEVDVKWVMEKLDAAGYDGDITVEYEVENVPAAEGLKQWYDFLAAL